MNLPERGCFSLEEKVGAKYSIKGNVSIDEAEIIGIVENADDLYDWSRQIECIEQLGNRILVIVENPIGSNELNRFFLTGRKIKHWSLPYMRGCLLDIQQEYDGYEKQWKRFRKLASEGKFSFFWSGRSSFCTLLKFASFDWVMTYKEMRESLMKGMLPHFIFKLDQLGCDIRFRKRKSLERLYRLSFLSRMNTLIAELKKELVEHRQIAVILDPNFVCPKQTLQENQTDSLCTFLRGHKFVILNPKPFWVEDRSYSPPILPHTAQESVECSEDDAAAAEIHAILFKNLTNRHDQDGEKPEMNVGDLQGSGLKRSVELNAPVPIRPKPTKICFEEHSSFLDVEECREKEDAADVLQTGQQIKE